MKPSNRNPILLVDDSVDDVELLLSALKRTDLKNEVITLHDGDEALDYLYRRGDFAQRDEPVVVLLDIKMPKVTGLEVLRQIKSDDKLKNIPVVMFTSSNQDSDISRSYQLGSNAYVVKPVDFNRLLDSVRTLRQFWTEVNEPPLRSAA